MFVRITMPDGTIWRLPARLVAEDRARYFAERDAERGYGVFDEVYAAEVNYAMREPGEITSWMGNNMSWADVEDLVQFEGYTRKAQPDYDGWWNEADMEVVNEAEV